jgi:hypothetical protein
MNEEYVDRGPLTQPVELFCSSCRDGVCPVPGACEIPSAEHARSIKFLAVLTALLRTTKGKGNEDR